VSTKRRMQATTNAFHTVYHLVPHRCQSDVRVSLRQGSFHREKQHHRL
jgi:hypothetical protein